MVTTLYFHFEGYSDFDDFLDEHEEVINMMGSSDLTDENLTDQMRMSVRAKEKLPEYFQFTSQQLTTMLRKNQSGMKSLMDDDRVTTEKGE